MTVSSTVRRNDYASSGITGPYAYTFRIFDATDLRVSKVGASGTETVLTYATDYTVSNVGNRNGGSVTLTTAIPSGYTIIVQRVRPFTQETDFRNQGPFFAETHEDALDHLTMIAQQLSDQITPTFRAPSTVNPASLNLEIPGLTPNSYLRVNNGGNGLEAVTNVVASQSFLQSGTGAVTRTMNAKAADTVSGRDFGAVGDGSTDDRGALARADTFVGSLPFGGLQVITAGTYRVASDLTLSRGVRIDPGAVIKPDSGVTITFAGSFRAHLAQCFDVSAGGFILFGRGGVDHIFPEWWGAANSASAATNTAAINAAILTSLNVKTLADQPILNMAPVVFSALYPVTTVYAPRFTMLRGKAGWRRYGLSSTADAPILVLGRSYLTPETDWLDIELRDFDIEGDTTKTAQVGIYASFSGATGYIAPPKFDNLKISNIGGKGIEITGDASTQIIYLDWRKVQIANTTSNAVHIKVGIFNAAKFDNCTFTDSGNGFFVEGLGGTEASETIRFVACHFEALGKPLGALTSAVGSYGFRSTMFTGHYAFHGCYFEGNGNNAGDTTGCNIDVRAPWMLAVHDSLLASSNNQIAMRYGGQASIRGNYITPGPNRNTVFLFDQPQPGSDYSSFDLGQNRYDTVYSDAQAFQWTNGSLTVVTGFRETRNYVSSPARARRIVLRDGSTKTVDDGAIGFGAVKRLTDNSGGATTIAVNGVGTIVPNTFNGRATLSVDVGAILAEVLLATGGALSLVSQVGTNVSTTKDTAAKVNVYHDAGLGAWVVQNKLASGIKAAVRLDGIDVMPHADDGYYETQFT